MVLQPNPVPLVQMSALDAPPQEGSERPLGVVAVSAPRTWLAASGVSAALGIALAATAKDGVVVGFVTVGTSHDGQEPEGAAKLDTPPPVPHPVVMMFPLASTAKLLEHVPEDGTVENLFVAGSVTVPVNVGEAAGAAPVTCPTE